MQEGAVTARPIKAAMDKSHDSLCHATPGVSGMSVPGRSIRRGQTRLRGFVATTLSALLILLQGTCGATTISDDEVARLVSDFIGTQRPMVIPLGQLTILPANHPTTSNDWSAKTFTATFGDALFRLEKLGFLKSRPGKRETAQSTKGQVFQFFSQPTALRNAILGYEPSLLYLPFGNYLVDRITENVPLAKQQGTDAKMRSARGEYVFSPSHVLKKIHPSLPDRQRYQFDARITLDSESALWRVLSVRWRDMSSNRWQGQFVRHSQLYQTAKASQSAYEIACAGEECNRRVLVTRDIKVSQSAPISLAATHAAAPARLSFPAGTWVYKERTRVLSRQGLGRAVTGRSSWGEFVSNAPRLHGGELFQLFPGDKETDECLGANISGHRLTVCHLEIVTSPKSEQWVRIRGENGSRGWLVDKPGDLVPEPQLVDGLAGAIVWAGKTDPPRTEAMQRIDLLIRHGADLNSPGSKHGRSPIETAVLSGNPSLVRSLIERGLNLNNGPSQCGAAYYARWQRPRQGSTRFLEFLLDNGMNIACLKTPPLHAFLTTGISTKGYDVDEAVETARFLIARGARVSDRDQQGQTILERFGSLKPATQAQVRPLFQFLESN